MIAGALKIVGLAMASFNAFKSMAQLGDGKGAKGAKGQQLARREADVDDLLFLFSMLGAFQFFEAYLDFFLSGLPLYGIVKLGFLSWLVFPHSHAGAARSLFTEPLLRMDATATAAWVALLRGAGNLSSIALRYALWGVRQFALRQCDDSELAALEHSLSRTLRVTHRESAQRLNASVDRLYGCGGGAGKSLEQELLPPLQQDNFDAVVTAPAPAGGAQDDGFDSDADDLPFAAESAAAGAEIDLKHVAVASGRIRRCTRRKKGRQKRLARRSIL